MLPRRIQGMDRFRWRYGARVTPAVLGFVVVLAACSKKYPEVAMSPVVDTVAAVDTVTVTTALDPNPALEQQVARLTIRLLEQEAQLEQLRAQRDAAFQEVLRATAKLQIVASRAEAASAIAEAKLAVDAFTTTAGDTVPEVLQAEQLLSLSGAELDRQNYGGALYLATQAKGLTRAGAASGVGPQRPLRPEELPFALSLPLETVARSNIRDGPGLTFAVLFTLDAGVPLVGHSHLAEWIRVSDANGREGWIFYGLVRSRKAHGN